jgi:hypothetical protein
VPAGGNASLLNVGSGSAAFSAQVIGYLAPNVPNSGAAFFPCARVRVLDVRLAY